MKLRHICEICGKEEVLTPEQAYEDGWDYPPKMGNFGVISPRTCGDCGGIDKTLWWALVTEKKSPDQLTPAQRETIMRILGEPKSILVEEEK